MWVDSLACLVFHPVRVSFLSTWTCVDPLWKQFLSALTPIDFACIAIHCLEFWRVVTSNRRVNHARFCRRLLGITPCAILDLFSVAFMWIAVVRGASIFHGCNIVELLERVPLKFKLFGCLLKAECWRHSPVCLSPLPLMGFVSCC